MYLKENIPEVYFDITLKARYNKNSKSASEIVVNTSTVDKSTGGVKLPVGSKLEMVGAGGELKVGDKFVVRHKIESEFLRKRYK